MEQKPIQLYMIGGFLGAGKTTLLQGLLSRRQGQPIGVLVNEFGGVGVDGRLLKQEGVTMVEINNGSIFCACLKQGFVRTLKALAAQPIDMLFIENSGMADPSSMGRILADLAPYLPRPYHYRGLICLVDCSTYLDYAGVLLPLENQVAAADLLLVNKTDLAAPGELEEIHRQLRDLNDRAFIYDTTFAALPEELLATALEHHGFAADSCNTPANRLYTWVISCGQELTAGQLWDFCGELGGRALRVKGFMPGAEGWWQVDMTGRSFRVEAAAEAAAAGLSGGELVVIAAADISQELRCAWDTCCGTAAEIKDGGIL